MPGLSLVSVFDASRALGSNPAAATPQSVANWLVNDYLKKSGGNFNYDPAIFAISDLYKGASSLEAAINYCQIKGNPKGREQNAEVIALAGPYALENVSRVYRIGFTAIAIGRIRGQTIYLGI